MGVGTDKKESPSTLSKWRYLQWNLSTNGCNISFPQFPRTKRGGERTDKKENPSKRAFFLTQIQLRGRLFLTDQFKNQSANGTDQFLELLFSSKRDHINPRNQSANSTNQFLELLSSNKNESLYSLPLGQRRGNQNKGKVSASAFHFVRRAPEPTKWKESGRWGPQKTIDTDICGLRR